MARNMKPEYIRKLMRMEVPNGYKFDVANYLHNPSYDFEYPSFRKTIAETSETITERRVYYFKHYDGTGEYIEQVLTFKKSEDGCVGWMIANTREENIIEHSNRFNLNKLISFI